MSEATVEIEIDVLRSCGLPGWGETKMELLNKAEMDIRAVDAILESIIALIGDADRHELLGDNKAYTLIGIARKNLARAKERVQICHNELDCEREGISPVIRD